MTLLDLKRKMLSFVFQPACCFCDADVHYPENTQQSEGEFHDERLTDDCLVCDECYHDTVGSVLDRCYYCGTETNPFNPFGSRCSICRDWNAKFERTISIGVYRSRLKKTVLEIKRDCNDVKAFQLGNMLGSIARRFDLPHNIDWVAPVPSHWRRRMSRRGFHVSDVIADGFCKSTGLKKRPKLLKCTRVTKKQAKLRPGQRIKNVRGAFKIVEESLIRNKRILLLDDVMTSGATISECSKVLIQAGAESVWVAVAARATVMS